jgi:phosphatidate cytidylyltransferase
MIDTSSGPGAAAATEPRRGSALRDLMPRLISAVVMVALALGAVFRGGEPFNLFWLAAALAVFWEWQRLIRAPHAVLRFLAGAIALVLTAMLARQMALDLAFVVCLLGCAALAALAGQGRRLWAAGGLVYAAALVVPVILLRLSLFDGIESILFLFAVVWGTDIFAYFGGRLIGGPKLWPRVSPSKTWSGFLCGVGTGAVLGVVTAGHLLDLDVRGMALLFPVAIATGAISQAGDLFESSVKRRFGAKDSSHLIPGHGGFMDRLDGFIFAAAFVAIIGFLRSGPAAVAIGVLRW